MRKIGWIILGLSALVQTGCLAAAVCGAAAAGGAAGYLYYNGLLYRDYHASLGDTIAAVRTSLAELQLPPLKEKGDTDSAFFETRTGDGHTVRIFLDFVPSPIPAEGAVTRVGIRVGFAGDDAISARILDQVSKHLVAPLAPAAAPSAAPIVGAPRPTPETAPPPLAAPGGLPIRPEPIAATPSR